jgi:hypothetical protein
MNIINNLLCGLKIAGLIKRGAGHVTIGTER